jgi:two-component system response regulator VicR
VWETKSVKRLVIVGTDPTIKPISDELAKEGFVVHTALDAASGLAKLKRTIPDLLIVELALPELSGKHICRYVREDDLLSRLPILLLTKACRDCDIVAGLDMGADAYITTPLTVRELIARIQSLLWRADKPAQRATALKHGDLVIDPESYHVSYLGEPVTMSLLEFRLLYYLASHPNSVFSREQLLRAVWDSEVIDPRCVDVCVRRLRSKLEKDPKNPLVLRTMRGSGYMLVVSNA